MDRKLVCATVVALALQIIGAARVMCPNDPNCVCGGTLAVELNCDIDGRTVKINLLPNTYINIKCENATSLDYNKLPKCANRTNTFKSVSFKDCPLPSTSFKKVLTHMGVSKTMALIFQNAKNLSGYFDRKHFAGLQDLTKLLLSINGVSHLPDNLFMDINKLTWLNIRSNTINLSEELFKPLERLETLEISHNHMTNISSNLFSHLSYLRKLSLWQSNVTWFSKDLFTGIDVLEELDLSSNGLNELPSLIFKPLRKLKKLTLFSNKFLALPKNLFKYNDKLETVVILNNDAKLIELPKYLFGGMVNLKQIYIQRSGLERLPYDVFANSSKITNISLAYNDLKSLSELIFNDQINLLELDLSNNKLYSLEPKIFSSLVRLEILNLNHNFLEYISGATFSPLLSLIYLDMEHNNLDTISSHLFSNNKQRMSISLAYNKLSFQEKLMVNNSWVVKKISPFAQTYNLRLLNLSHNNFKSSFEDWWINGHDILDISNNCIANLWPEEDIRDYRYKHMIKKPMKQLWIAEIPLSCDCPNFYFTRFLSDTYKTQILLDNRQSECPFWAKESCYMELPLHGIVLLFVVFIYIFFFYLLVKYRRILWGCCKRKFRHECTQNRTSFLDAMIEDRLYDYNSFTAFSIYYDQTGKITMFVYFDSRDSEFVYNQLLLALMHYGKTQIAASRPNKMTRVLKKIHKALQRLTNCIACSPPIALVVFSPNFVMSQYSKVDIGKIPRMMTEQQNAVYIFADIGPDNSVYDFLKHMRNKDNSIVWDEPNFWKNLSKKADVEKIATLCEHSDEVVEISKSGDCVFTPDALHDADLRSFMSNSYKFNSLSEKDEYKGYKMQIKYKV